MKQDLLSKFVKKKNKYKKINYELIQKSKQYKQELISKSTLAEQRVKDFLSENGIKHKFQEIIYYENPKIKDKIEGFFIVDFLIGDKKIVEVDGLYHNDIKQIAKDDRREKKLKQMGYKIVRITNGLTKFKEVLNDRIFGC